MVSVSAVATGLALLSLGQPLLPLSNEFSQSGRICTRATSGGFSLSKEVTVLTQEVRNYDGQGGLTYRDRVRGVGVVLPAKVKGRVIEPAAIVSTRTTYRGVEVAQQNLTYVLPRALPTELTQVSGARWAETGRATAEPGQSLVATLHPGPAGERVVCTSGVTGTARDGFVYTYRVRNETTRPFKFEWGEHKGELQPGRGRTFEVTSSDVFTEQSGACVLTFADNQEFSFPVNAWSPAKP